MTLKQLTHSACDESGATDAFAKRLLDLVRDYGLHCYSEGRSGSTLAAADAEEKLKEIAAALDTAAPDA